MSHLEKARARFALERVREIKGSSSSDRSEVLGRAARTKLKTQLLKMPARLHNTGLGQTAAYLLAQKPESAERRVVGWLESWLSEDEVGIYPTGPALIDHILGNVQGSNDDLTEELYRRASVEARALAVWLKRFAEAFLREETKE